MRKIGLLLAGLLCGCALETTTPAVPTSEAYQSFLQVVSRVEPVAERECRTRTRGMNCDFHIVIDATRNLPPNAFQSLSEDGRPVLTFSLSLIEDMDNDDELAFVVGHEAAHHVLAHIAREVEHAKEGAEVFARLAQQTGGSEDDVRSAYILGAAVGARSYSKEFELEADAMGTVIAHKAGYDPVRGAAYFTRLPDPGNEFLGSHPPNAARIEIVKLTASKL